MRVGDKQKTLLRWEAVVAAFLMLLSMMLVVMPDVMAADSNKPEVTYSSSSNRILVDPSDRLQTVAYGNPPTSIIIPYTSEVTDSKAQFTVSMPSGLYLRNTASTQSFVLSNSGTFPSFAVEADESVKTGIVPITLSVVYHKADGTETTETITYSVQVINYSSEESSTPSAPELIGNQITVSKNAFMPEIKAGETKEIQIPLNASAVVGTAQVTLTMPDGLYLESASATQSVNFRKGASSISCKVTAKKDVTDSVASIGIKSVYQYDSKQVQEDTTFSVRLRASQVSESTGKLVITEYKLGASNLSYNGNTDLTVTVQNTGTAAMKEITMTLDGMATGSVTLKSGMDVQTLKELLPGQTSTFTYQLHADETVSTGTAILTATAACGENTSVAKIFVPCTGKPEDKGGSGEEGPGSSKPQIIIESYTYGDGVTSVTGGSTFTLTMTLRNTSASTAIQNIKMVVSSAADDQTGGAFTPASSSNSFYIASVGAGETFTESIDLIARADASPKSYGISVELSYDAIVDKKMENLTSTETITIPVTQPDRFEVDDVQIDSMPYVGDSIYCSVSYVNKGKSTIYNLSIAVEGTGFTTADTNTYIGNVEAGSGDSFSPTLNTSEAGPVEGKIIFTYEDASGNQSTIEKPFSTTVQEMDWGDDSGDMTPDEPVDTNTGLPLWGKIAIIAGCVIAAGVIVVVVIKIRKKKKKPASPYDDYDDGDDSDYDDQYNDGDDE